MQACSLCADLNALEIVFEDLQTAVIVHDDWAVRGHLMVVWKRHVENLSDLDAADFQHFMTTYRRAERAALDVTGADRAIVMKLGIATPHLHVHIYPVSAKLDRTQVMAIIDARDREKRDEHFVTALRRRLDSGFRAE